MKHAWKPPFLILLGIFLLVFGFHTSARAQEELQGNPLAGGQLFAAWDIVLQVELPEENHPLWHEKEPLDLNSWRCVTCHGWDYSGREISLGTETEESVNYPGVFSMMAEPEENVIAWLDGGNNRDHDFSDYLSQEDMQDLSAFLITSLIQSNLYVEEGSGRVRGTALAGETLYKGKCRECHGSDGSRINFGSANRPAFLGNLANVNPWRGAHIIRFGHYQSDVKPGTKYGWSFNKEIDLLSYLQLLPLAKQIINGDEVVVEVIDYSQQGEVQPLIYGAVGIILVILGGVYWGSRWNRE